ncbi:molybdenum cofactor guanylyltransferase MobA [Granulosicoccus antarcticus]|uniref:Molybdenum cofactor guanylyltransferase n=1 Tax=Granulosicoccus antarcticus IMCC3135 TaxID=1192854 RepID=A0A2Z2NUW0_9GAMM|nr:molybdenum cofactor guanylyltransferase MobA [Granulosicoccus antarcticus]ASJ75033.1 Molybdenum cofactor guanylyltransferase [Granulosicoccus antarcticus IMCC3135]
MASTGALILAGGLARRMGGQDKGLVMLAESPMVSYALRTVQPLVDRCVINANRHLDVYSQFGVPVITDQLEGHLGPLAGLSAGIDALDTDYVFMCPCDSPFVQAELFQALLSACIETDADLSVPHDGERLQPIFVVVHRRVKESLDLFLASGQRKIDRWFDELKVQEVPAGDFIESFRNINTEEERLATEQGMLR